MNGRTKLVAVIFFTASALLLAACGTVRLRPQTGETQVRAEQIRAGKVHEYVLRAKEGEVLSVRLVSPASGLSLTVADRDQEYKLLRPTDRAINWTGVLPAKKEYVISVEGSQIDAEYLLAVARLPQRANSAHDRFMGVYRAETPKANARHKLTLFLNEDGAAALVGLVGVESLEPFVMRGAWSAEGEAATLRFTEQDGEPFKSPEIVKLRWWNGLLVVDNQGMNDIQSWRTAGLRLAPAQGDYHAMVRELHRQLVAVGYLSAVDPGPGGDIYSAVTHQAVLSFQEAQGLSLSGVADAATWAALGIALLPERTATGEPILYLTFDDGPDGTYTPQILELLARYDAQATFFILGEQASYFPDIIRAEAEAGHYLANHGYAHHSFEGMDRNTLYREIQKTDKLLGEAAGDLFAWDGDVHFVRPPYGLTDDATQEIAGEFGYVVVTWDVDSHDWQLPGATQIAWNVVNGVRPGDIVLMHDGGGDRSQTVAALEMILQRLGAEGYRFRSIFGSR